MKIEVVTSGVDAVEKQASNLRRHRLYVFTPYPPLWYQFIKTTYPT
jgi:hypothetical protein